MTDTQFDILDELYFIISYQELLKVSEIQKEILDVNLKEMIKIGWVKCFKGETELELREVMFETPDFESYSFLATKKGLFSHNLR